MKAKSVTVRVSVSLPTILGVNEIEMVHVALGGMLTPQVLV